MRGAIGNAILMNIVLTFIFIFFMLLIGSIAYSRAYNVNRYLVDRVTSMAEDYDKGDGLKKFFNKDSNVRAWNNMVNPQLQKAGYYLSNVSNTCPKPNVLGSSMYDSTGATELIWDTKAGAYDYCIYQIRLYEKNQDDDNLTKKRFYYRVISYARFDFPLIGGFIKMPIKGETRTIIKFKNQAS